MAKKNAKARNVTPAPVATAPVAPVSIPGIVTGMTADEQQQLTNLEQQLANLRKQKEDREKAAVEDLKRRLNELPAQFGIVTTAEMIELLKRHEKNLIGAPAATTGARGRRLSDDVKARVESDIKANTDTAKVIAERNGCSVQFVHIRRKALGMVTARKAAA